MRCNIMDTVGRIKEMLKERNWSVYKLSKKSGISQSTLSNMFKRNNDPSIGTLEDICHGLGITLSQFFANDNDLVSLDKDQKEMLNKWSSLNSEQKRALLELLK